LDSDNLLESNEALKRALRTILSTSNGRSVYEDAIAQLKTTEEKLSQVDAQELGQEEAELVNARAVLTLLLRGQ